MCLFACFNFCPAGVLIEICGRAFDHLLLICIVFGNVTRYDYTVYAHCNKPPWDQENNSLNKLFTVIGLVHLLHHKSEKKMLIKSSGGL